MDEIRADQTILEDFHFEALYQGKEPLTGVETGFDRPPWDIGEAQPAIVALEATGQLRSAILDAGCGLGDNALFLAGRGYRVTGFDGAPTAVAKATERAATAPGNPEFLLADATRLDGWEPRFATVLDSALYHCLSDEQRGQYAAALHRVTEPNAQLHLFCFSDADDPGITMPNQVSQENLRTYLGEHWDIRGIEPTRYATAFGRDYLLRQSASEAPVLEIDPDALLADEQGRVQVPMWYVHAVRK